MRAWTAWASASILLLLAACGGGEGVAKAVRLDVRVTADGTHARCEGQEREFQLERLSTGRVATIQCPGEVMLDRDFRPSRWVLRDALAAVAAEATSQLPAPLLLQLGTTTMVVPEAWVDHASLVYPVRLQARTNDGITQEFTTSRGLLKLPAPPSGIWASVRWIVDEARGPIVSVEAAIREASFKPIGVEGALTVGDLLGTGKDELVGLSQSAAAWRGTYAALGLGWLLTEPGRVFRDLRTVDLDGDGLEDVVSNVYDGGCTVIGFNRGGGRFEWTLPTREDGSCVSGHGETIAIADFDGDGRTDIFIPFYERWDLLLNLSNGRFVNVAQERGIAYPNYIPPAEGAAAVDIDLNGTIDIVVANEVLLNDGHARFTPLPNPFGPMRIFDEGIYVADADGDGLFDIIRHHPVSGPRAYWGLPGRQQFLDGADLLPAPARLSRSFGLAVGDLTGNGLLDIVYSGGDPGGTSPGLCIQIRKREYSCIEERWPEGHESRQDLLLVHDIDGDRRPDVIARFTPNLQKATPTLARVAAHLFDFDLRDVQGRRNLHGRSVRISCASDGSLVTLRFVDGGNGFLSSGPYTISAGSDRCDRVRVEFFARSGTVDLGIFPAGHHRVRVAAAPGG